MLKALDKWLWPWIARNARMPGGPVRHVYVAICDHFEPHPPLSTWESVIRWRDEYPGLVEPFRDSDGRKPRHTFFYPVEMYQERDLHLLLELCARSGSEIEVQLHHDGDTEETLRRQLRMGIDRLVGHGCLPVDREGRTRFGFVHGNWALANCRPDGRLCGVATELRLLREMGCYADFTFPSAPSPTQPRSVNRIGYARECGSPTALDRLTPSAAGRTGGWRDRADSLLLVEGPLAPDWSNRKWGVLPRIENADLTGAYPPTPERARGWLGQRVHVEGRPDHVFIKLHTHGADKPNIDTMLGEPIAAMHRFLTTRLLEETGAALHYVTAREMVNVIHALEDELPTPPSQWFDYLFRLREG